MCDSTRGWNGWARRQQPLAAWRPLRQPTRVTREPFRPLGRLLLCVSGCWGRAGSKSHSWGEKGGDSPPLLLVRADGEAPAVERQGHEISARVPRNRCVQPRSRKSTSQRRTGLGSRPSVMSQRAVIFADRRDDETTNFLTSLFCTFLCHEGQCVPTGGGGGLFVPVD